MAIARPRNLHYAWVVAGVAFVTLVMSAGFRSVSGVLLVPLHEAFGWSHEVIGLAIAVNLLCFGLGSPFAAALVERFGLRRVMLVALATVALSSLLTIGMTETWQLILLWGVVNGTATGAISVPLAAIVSTRWFVARRGFVTGLLTASNATGQLVFLPLLAWIAGFDWRWAAVVVAGAAGAIVIPLVAWKMRDRPVDIEIAPYGSDVHEPAPPVPNAFRLALDAGRSAMRSRTFWFLSGSFFICGVTTTGIVGSHLVPAAHDHGITQVTAASLLALIGIFDIVGTTISGWLTDRYDGRWLLFWYYGFRGLSLLALPVIFEAAGPGLVVFAIFYGLNWVSTVPPTVALTVQGFGSVSAGVVFGWVFAAHQLGAAAAAQFAGTIRTLEGDYQLAFYSTGALAFVASLLVIRIARAQPVAAAAA